MTSSNQDIKTNVATLVCRKGVRGSCFILCRVFLSMLALEKNMPSSRCVVWKNKVTHSTTLRGGKTIITITILLP